MRFEIFILLLCLSSCSCLNIRGLDIPKDGSPKEAETFRLEQQLPPWDALYKGQFIRDIMFGIHPESPRNRDIWIKSGLLRPRDQLRTIPLPIMGQGQVGFNPKPEVKKRPFLRRKLIPSKRLPKLSDDVTANLPKKNVSETNNTNNNHANKPQAPPNKPSELSVPITTTVNSEPSNIRRCFVQTTVPAVYYFLPIGPRPFVPPSTGYNYPRPSKNQPSLFTSGQYAPMQNRLPYPPRVVYWRPLPIDLLAMEDNKDEQKVTSIQETIPSITQNPNAFSTLVKSTPSALSKNSEPNESKVKISTRLPEIIDMEFRGDSEIIAKSVEKERSSLNTPETKLVPKGDKESDQELSFRSEPIESVTSVSDQDIITISE